MLSPSVLVYGFYKQELGFSGNLGDNFFKEAFRTLFPNYRFTFTDEITEQLLSNQDAVFLGGGSFLNVNPYFSEKILKLLQTKPLCYLGVGAETDIRPVHQSLLAQAQVISTRSEHFESLSKINSKTFHCPDLVYVLSSALSTFPPPRELSILVLPNAYLINKYDAPSWAHLSWEHFKSEFAQFLDHKYQEGFQVDFFPMCTSSSVRDYWAEIEIRGKMKHSVTGAIIHSDGIATFSELAYLMSRYQIIISQRYHGLVMSEILNRPCINIHHHNKLKNFQHPLIKNVPYYAMNKDVLNDGFNSLLKLHNSESSSLAITSHLFSRLKEEVQAIF